MAHVSSKRENETSKFAAAAPIRMCVSVRVRVRVRVFMRMRRMKPPGISDMARVGVWVK